jgi:hypothetical protein
MEKDVFDELEGDMVSQSLLHPTPPPSPSQRFYRPPTHPYALAIWREARIPMRGEQLAVIEYYLTDWMNERKCAFEKDGITYIKWVSNNMTFTADWPTFLKWVLNYWHS